MLRGVLFDMGGTLLEYKREDWAELDKQLNSDLHTYIAARGHAAKMPPLDEFLEVFNARTRGKWAEASRTQKSFNMLDVLDELFSEHGIMEQRSGDYLAPWYRTVADMTYVRPDVRPTLERLRDGGLKLGLVSNTAWPSAVHDPDLERFELLDLLECRVYSCELGWEKPAPPIFRAALECLSLEPEETVFVGDFRRYDIAGAHAVGMKGVWKRIDDRPEEIDDPGIIPDATITTIGELPEALSVLYGVRI